LTLLAIGGLNTVLSLFYYLRVVRVMVLSPEPAERPAPSIPLYSAPGAYVVAMAAMLIAMFLSWGWLSAWAQVSASALIR
jgi:NADH-quinone oxidoreductase subunit N